MESDISTTLTLTPLIAYLGAWVSTCGLTWVLFSRGEAIISHDVKVRVRNALKGESDLIGRVETWPQQFSELFDVVFGKKHLSGKCFNRSVVASILAGLITFLIWWSLRPEYYFELFSQDDISLILLILVASSISYNSIPDYISLLESRFIIRKMSQTSSVQKWVLLLCLDFVLTIIVFIICSLSIMIPIHIIKSDDASWSKMYDFLITDMAPATIYFSHEEPFLTLFGIFFYSTFFTSVWVWLYVLANIVVRLSRITDCSWGVLTYLVNIDDKPILSLGTISIVLITLGYLVAAPFVLIR